MIKNYIATYIMDITALVFIFVLLFNNNLLNKQRRRALSFGVIFTIIVILAEFGTILFSQGDANMRFFHITCNVFGFVLTPIIPIVLVSIFDQKIISKHKVLLVPTVINAVFVILSPFFGLIFSVGMNNIYVRGQWFFIFVVVYIINILLFAGIIWYSSKKHFYPIKEKVVILSLVFLVGTFVQIFEPSIYSSWHAVTLFLLLFYIILIEFQGSFDSLTKLFNRQAFDKLSKRFNGKKSFCAVSIDVNDLKEINDNYGHSYGDKVIKKMASIIKESFDNNCSCYRVGGDEFYIIRRDGNKEKLEAQLKNMTSNLIKERIDNKNLPTVSYGYSIFRAGEVLDFEKVLKEADDQMYYYKSMHKKKNN